MSFQPESPFTPGSPSSPASHKRSRHLKRFSSFKTSSTKKNFYTPLSKKFTSDKHINIENKLFSSELITKTEPFGIKMKECITEEISPNQYKGLSNSKKFNSFILFDAQYNKRPSIKRKLEDLDKYKNKSSKKAEFIKEMKMDEESDNECSFSSQSVCENSDSSKSLQS